MLALEVPRGTFLRPLLLNICSQVKNFFNLKNFRIP